MIYLDNAATTKVDLKVLKEMNKFNIKNYANASSLHEFGRVSKTALENARKTIAASINALLEEIYFTSSGTEANNLALKGIFFSSKKRKIITSKIEHSSVLETCRWLEKKGAKINYLDVNSEGFIDLEQLKKIINKNTLLVSVVHGNNEIGTIQDIKKIGEICEREKVLFHIDACQSYMKLPIDVKKNKISMMSLDAQKIHGPKGVGAIYIKRGIKITPLLHGGGQERNLRSSTENISGIVGFAEAVKVSSKKDNKKINSLRDFFIKEVLKIPGSKLNGTSGRERLINNINIQFKEIDSEVLKDFLSNEGIYCSIGSACSGKTRSHVLKALGLSDKEINSSIRFSLSKYNNKKEIKDTILLIKKFRKCQATNLKEKQS